MGAGILTVGNVNVSNLEAIAADPDEDRLFYTTAFSGLTDLVDKIIAEVSSGILLTGEGGASPDSRLFGGGYFDIEFNAADGSIRSPVLLRDGQVMLVSWQEDYLRHQPLYSSHTNSPKDQVWKQLIPQVVKSINRVPGKASFLPLLHQGH